MLHLCNLPREICHKLLGKEHTPKHRMMAGVGVMVGGVFIANVLPTMLHFPGAHFMFDMIGYAVHGLGAIPFIEHALD